MTNESIETRLARIEDGMVGLHGKLDNYHSSVKEMMTPIQKRQDKHHDWIVTLMRDRFWVFSLASFAASSSVYLLMHILK